VEKVMAWKKRNLKFFYLLFVMIIITSCNFMTTSKKGKTTPPPYIWSRQLGTKIGLRRSVISNCITRDTFNDLYIAGSTDGNLDGNTLNGQSDLFLTKYNSSGAKQWTQQLGVSTKDTSAYGIAIDSNSNIYLTGSTTGGLDGNTLTGTNDLFVTKYNSSGIKQWTRQLGVSGKYTFAYGIAIDSSNNIYLTGSTFGGLDGNTLTGTNDLFVTKYNSSGVKQWTQQMGVSGKETYALSLKIDSSNNFYVTGYTTGSLDGNTLTGAMDLFVTKYNSSGVKQWTQELGVIGQYTYANGIAIDTTNNVYVSGYTTGGLDGNTLSGTNDLFVTKYNSNGTKQWTQQLGVSGKETNGYGIALDSTNNIYLTGHTSGDLDGNTLTGTRDLFVVKYNSNGVKLWTQQLGVSGQYTNGTGITLDTTNNIYLTGYTDGALDGNLHTGTNDLLVTKYNSSGTKQWTEQLGTNTNPAYTNSKGITIDSANNLYISGITNGALDGNTLTGINDLYVTKYNSSGIKQWTQQLGVSGKFTNGFGITSDSNSNIYLAGYTNGSLDGNTLSGSNDLFVTKYNSSGVKQWTQQLGVSSKDTYAYGITIDSNSNVYLTGVTTGGLDGNTLTGTTDLFVTKYNSSGVKQWTRQLGVSSKDTFAYGIATDSSNNIYLTGSTYGGLDGNSQTGINDLFVIKYNDSGVKQWSQQKGVSGKEVYALGIKIDSSNNFYVTGYTTGNLDGNTLTGAMDLFVTKYNSSGVKQWTQQLGVNSQYTYANSIAIDTANNVYVSGYTTGGLDGNTLTGTNDLFVTKYNSSGTKQWTQQLGVSGKFTYGYGIAIDSISDIYLTGYTNGGLAGNQLTGTSDLFVIKYNSSGGK
jgi:hypothetical protein